MVTRSCGDAGGGELCARAAAAIMRNSASRHAIVCAGGRSTSRFAPLPFPEGPCTGCVTCVARDAPRRGANACREGALPSPLWGGAGGGGREDVEPPVRA